MPLHTLHPEVIAKVKAERAEQRRKEEEQRIDGRMRGLDRRLIRLEAMLEAAPRNPAPTPLLDENFCKELGAMIREFVNREVGRAKNEIAALGNRVRSLETQPQLKYMGVWESGVDYARNSLVTHEGGLWIAKSATGACPGAVHDQGRAWQLCVKKGKDGKNWRDEKGWPTP